MALEDAGGGAGGAPGTGAGLMAGAGDAVAAGAFNPGRFDEEAGIESLTLDGAADSTGIRMEDFEGGGAL